MREIWRNEELCRLLGAVALGWVVVAGVDTACTQVMGGGLWSMTDWTVRERLGLMAYELESWGMVGGVLALVTVGCWALGRRRGNGRFWHVAGGVGLRGMLAVVGVLFAAEWTVFSVLRIFPEWDAMKVWLAQSGQAIKFVPTGRIVQGVVLAAFGLAAGVALPSAGRWLSRRMCIGLATAALAMVAAAVLGRWACPVAATGGSEARKHQATYEEMRDYRTGPFASFRGHLLREPPGFERLELDARLRIEQTPIVTMEAYLHGADVKGMRRLNVVVIVVESLRADEVAAYGGNPAVMPHVNELAQESRYFRRAYTQATHTNYACPCPLSSEYPYRELTEYAYPKEIPYPRVLLYDILKKVGYKTGFFSSANETWFGLNNFWETGNLDVFLHAETWHGKTYVDPADWGFAEWAAKNQRAGNIDDRATVDEAVHWVEGLGNTPFFLYLALQNSHMPYLVPPDFKRPFGPDKLDFAMVFGNYPPAKSAVARAVYRDALNYSDVQLGRLFAALKAQGKWENTVIVLTGDHGQGFHEHGFSAHGNKLYDELLRVPLLVKGPGIAAGPSETPAQLIDVSPTVLEVLGLPRHPAQQGVSVLTLPGEQPIFAVVQCPIASETAVIWRGKKVIYDLREKSFTMFDLEKDPGETHNLEAERADETDAMIILLQSWMSTQLRYYQNPGAMRLLNPPRLIVPEGYK